MNLAKSALADVAERCGHCIALLTDSPWHWAGQRISTERPAQFDQMEKILTKAQRIAGSVGDSGALQGIEVALDLVHQVIVLYDQTCGLGEHPLPERFLWELIAMRAAIQVHLKGVDWSGEEDLSLPYFPDLAPSPDWNRTRCAFEMAKALHNKIAKLRSFRTLIERAVGVAVRPSSTSTALVEAMVSALDHIERVLVSENPEFELAIRLSNEVLALFVMFELQDPTVSSWGLKGSLATLKETIEEAKLDPLGPRVY